MPYEIPPRKRPADDSGYLEELTKAIFQAGFSWRVIRDKWPNFQQALDGFDIETVAGYGEPDVERLMPFGQFLRSTSLDERNLTWQQ